MTDVLSSTFAALADPTRRAILSRLADREATVNELAEPFDISLQAVSRHLKVLEHAGLITRGARLSSDPAGWSLPLWTPPSTGSSTIGSSGRSGSISSSGTCAPSDHPTRRHRYD